MKKAAIILLLGSLLLVFAGIVFAAEINGVISAVDASKGVLSLKDGSQFDGVAAALLKGFKAGDDVKVEYREEGGKKIVTRGTKPPIGC